MDEDMQEFIMYYGEEDNKNACLFVEQMRVVTLKKMEDAAVDGEESSKGSGVDMDDLSVTLTEEDRRRNGNNGEEESLHSLENTRGGLDKAEDAATQEEDDANDQASNVSSGKTQDNTAMAEAKNAGKKAEEAPGQALP